MEAIARPWADESKQSHAGYFISKLSARTNTELMMNPFSLNYTKPFISKRFYVYLQMI